MSLGSKISHLLTDHSRLQHEKFHSAPGSRVGTPAYLAPEVIMTTKGQTYDGKVTISPSLCLCHLSCNHLDFLAV